MPLQFILQVWPVPAGSRPSYAACNQQRLHHNTRARHQKVTERSMPCLLRAVLSRQCVNHPCPHTLLVRKNGSCDLVLQDGLPCMQVTVVHSDLLPVRLLLCLYIACRELYAIGAEQKGVNSLCGKHETVCFTVWEHSAALDKPWQILCLPHGTKLCIRPTGHEWVAVG